MLEYAITDRRMFAGDEGRQRAALAAQAQELTRRGTAFLQLREKDLRPAALLALARGLRQAVPAGTPPRLLLNGPATLAAEAGFDGVHLAGGWTPAILHAARASLQAAGVRTPLLSVTAHTLAEISAAREVGADLILFGPVFEKHVRGELVRPGVGLNALAAAVHAAGDTPLLALGGITPATVPGCLAAGAAGIAAIRLFLPGASAMLLQRPARREKIEEGPC